MDISTPRQTSMAGPGLAMTAMLFFSMNDMIFKVFSDDYAMHQLVFTRCAIAFALITLGVALFGDGLGSLKTRHLSRHLFRGLLVVMANMSFFLAVAAMPLAEVVAIFFVSPLLITVFSVVFLGETVGPWRWFAILVGFAGVLIIVRPGSDAFQIAALLPIFAATCYAGLHMMTRVLGRTDGAPTLAFYVQIVFIVTSLSIGLIVGDGRFGAQSHPSAAFFFRAWAWPDLADLPLMLWLGVCVAAGAYLISAAYRLSEAALVAPFEYVAMPLAIIFGIVFFDEWPEPVVWAGIALIISSGLFMLWREFTTGRSPAAPVPRSRR